MLAVPLILSEVLVVNNQQATDSVTLRYTSTPQTSSHFDRYRFSLSDPNIPVKEKLANDTERKVLKCIVHWFYNIFWILIDFIVNTYVIYIGVCYIKLGLFFHLMNRWCESL